MTSGAGCPSVPSAPPKNYNIQKRRRLAQDIYYFINSSVDLGDCREYRAPYGWNTKKSIIENGDMPSEKTFCGGR